LLAREGVVENIGGHGSIAVLRLKKDVEDSRLFELLRRVSFEAQRRRRRR